MSKLIFFNMVSIDGFFEGKNKELDWHIIDEEFNEFAIEQLNSADRLIFGRKTYEGMANYWTSERALSNDPMITKRMNEISKNVFSKKLVEVNWKNTNLFKNSVFNVVSDLKEKSSKNVLVLGSANLSETLTKDGLIDLYRIMINPIILGKGNPLFPNLDTQLKLKLVNSRTFDSGNVLMEYEPKQN